MLRKPSVEEHAIDDALNKVDALARPWIETILKDTESQDWDFAAPEAGEPTRFAYSKDFTFGHVTVSQEGEGEGTTYHSLTVSLNYDEPTQVTGFLAEKIFTKLEETQGRVQSFQESFPFRHLESRFDLPLLTKKEVLEELKMLEEKEANLVVTMMSLAADSNWKGVPSPEGHNIFRYQLIEGETRVDVSLKGDLTDCVTGSYELSIVLNGEFIHHSNSAIAREFFDAIEAHRGRLSDWLEAQAYREE